MNRTILSLFRQQRPLLRRALHKGVDSTPPLRYTSNAECVALYLLITVTFLSYPSYVLVNLDKMRPKPDNSLNPDVQAQIDAIRAARNASK